ncbi:MAG: phospholipid scramblase-related protein [Chloroflexi bacterium]|nr:phospholipid scramblase-related protein [Chloroflexota bacterium]
MLETYEHLIVRQQVEPLQVFTGLEMNNRYTVIDDHGNDILFAYEESSFISRQFLGSHRPLTINVIDSEGTVLMTASRGFFWLLSHLELRHLNGSVIGGMQRRFKMLGRRFDLYDENQLVGTIEGPVLRPHTFWIHGNGVELAKITKQWSGAGREMFTAADTFHIEFTTSSSTEQIRWLILGAAFSIDLDFFENRKRRGSVNIGGFGR